MFRMLSCFDLRPDVSVRDFCEALARLSTHMHAAGLLDSTSPVGRRQRHPVMDTDAERDHEFFFIMSFGSRSQCDRAVAYMYRHDDPGDDLHRAVYRSIADPVFVCWEDIDTET